MQLLQQHFYANTTLTQFVNVGERYGRMIVMYASHMVFGCKHAAVYPGFTFFVL